MSEDGQSECDTSRGDFGSELEYETRISSCTDYSKPIDCVPIVYFEPGVDASSRTGVDECFLLEYGVSSDAELPEWVKSKVKGLSRFLGTTYGAMREKWFHFLHLLKGVGGLGAQHLREGS